VDKSKRPWFKQHRLTVSAFTLDVGVHGLVVARHHICAPRAGSCGVCVASNNGAGARARGAGASLVHFFSSTQANFAGYTEVRQSFSVKNGLG